jgi:Ca2+-binding RTX toxin-like protein
MTTNVNPLSNAQLHQLQVMLDNDDISSFYQFLLARNYNYAGWAQGVAAEDSIAGIAAVQYMKGTANTGVQKDAGDKLTATQIGSIKLGMAQGYLNALVTISNSELDGTVHRDISASEMESFHKEVFAANNMSIENWTLYSVFEIVRRTEGQYGVESLWSDLSSTRGDGIDATLANFAVLLEMQQWSKSTDPVISELAEYWLKHVPGVFGLDQWLNSVQTLAIFGQSEIVSSQLALYEIVTSSETVFNPLAVMHLSFTAATMWRPALRDPLILDLDHDGLETTGLTENLVMFDHDGDGVKAASGWIKADDAFLVMDRNNNGTVDNGTELFGDATRLYTGGSAKDGFEALAQEDTNNDGKIDDLDKNWEKLSIWSDKNQDGISQSEEIKNVSEAGIVEISIIKIANNQVLGNGNVIADLGSFKTTDGLSNTLGGAANMGDVNLAEDPFYTRFTESVPISQAIKNLPNMQGSGQARNLLEAATLSTRVGELLSQFSTESSKKNQLEILELLVDAWADSSSMAVNLQSRVSSNYEVIYQNLGEKSAGAYSETEWDQIVGSLERKIHTLEVFNGKYFFHLPSDTAGSGSVAGLTIGETLASGKAEIKVSLSSDQMQLIDSAYTQLSQEIYPLLALQTRLNSYLKLVEVKIIPGGVALDFSLLNQEIENQLLQQPELAIPDIADLINFSPSSWHYHGWDGVRILGDYLNNKSITPELKALLNFDKIAVGTLSTDFISTAHAVSNIFALDGDDTITDGGGSDYIDGGAGDDSITDRGIGTNILRGGDGNDTISFDSLANNTIEGGSGSDIIKVNNTSSRSSATSTLSGGAGNDTITGGLEADIYLFNRGDGYDIIREDGGSYTIDKLVFGTGIARNDLTFSRVGNDLVIKIADAAQATATDQVTMQSWYSADYFQVEQLVLADGTMLSAAQATSLGVAIINGTEGVDILNGSTDDTVINGFSGNDTINDGGGSDVIDGGAGDDSITDRGIGTNILRGGDGNDTISFDNLANNTIEGGSGSDIIKVNNTSSRSSATSTLSGGAGNDTITGGLEADIYLFNRGDGYDIIREDGGSYTIDKLVFGTGIARNDLTFSRVGDDLVIKIADAAQATVTDQVTMQSWYSADYFQVEQLVLADGTMLSAAQATSLGVAIINGTEGVDILNGSTDDTVINGFSGNDTINDGGGSDVIDGGAGDDSITDRGIGTNILRGGDGNDTISFDNLANNTIEGGSGSDIIKVNNTSSRSSATSTLSGGAGNDTITGGLEADIYLFNRGDGYDIIREDGGSYTIDKLVFGTGIARNDLMFSRVGDDLVIKIADAAQATVADQVTMQSWYTADYFQVEQLVLADGTMLSATEAISLVGVAATTI